MLNAAKSSNASLASPTLFSSYSYKVQDDIGNKADVMTGIQVFHAMGIEIRALVPEILEGKRWNGGRDEFSEIRSFLSP